MDYFKQLAQNKADKAAETIENLCIDNGLTLDVCDGRIEITASVKDDEGKEWHAYKEVIIAD